MKAKLTSMGFTSGHAQVIAAAFLVVAGLIFFSTDSTLKNKLSNINIFNNNPTEQQIENARLVNEITESLEKMQVVTNNSNSGSVLGNEVDDKFEPRGPAQ